MVKVMLVGVMGVGSVCVAVAQTTGPAGDMQMATTAPEMREAKGMEGRPLDRLRESLGKLNLTEEQRGQVRELFEDVRAKIQQVREEADGKMDEMREKARPIVQDAREKLRKILDEKQQKKLRELMGREEGPGMMMGGEMDGARGEERKSERRNAERREVRAATGPAVGERAPDVSLKKPDGSAVQLSSYKGRVVVLEFGSYSSPAFRKRAAAMEQLKNQMGGVATFLVVYTKEAHPEGGWEVDRNKDEKISADVHKTASDRKAAANKAKQVLKITIPMMMDDMEDSAAKGLGAGENSLVVIGKDGRIAGRQEWADPYGARRLIEQAARSNATTVPVAR